MNQKLNKYEIGEMVVVRNAIKDEYSVGTICRMYSTGDMRGEIIYGCRSTYLTNFPEDQVLGNVNEFLYCPTRNMIVHQNSDKFLELSETDLDLYKITTRASLNPPFLTFAVDSESDEQPATKAIPTGTGILLDSLSSPKICSCGASHTSNPKYHLEYCQLSEEL